MIYANNAGTSWPKPASVIETVASVLAADPTRHVGIFDTARADVCRFLGITNEERFLFTPGCTAALSVAIEGLPWRTGETVVTGSLEHHAVVRPVEKLARERGVNHAAAPYRPGEPIDLDFVRNVLRRGGVRLVAVSAASNVTGEILPIAELAGLAHEHGALCLVDAAQLVGVVPVDVTELGADILALAGHKGPLGPQGVGGLWAADHVRFESPSASCEVGGSARASGAAFPDYCDVGGVNQAGAAGLGAGMRWLAAEHAGDLGLHARRLAERLREALRDRSDCRVFGGSSCERTATVSVTFDRLPLVQAERFFASHDVVVRAGRHCAPLALDAIEATEGTVRISFGPFNGEDDVARLVEAVEAAGAMGGAGGRT